MKKRGKKIVSLLLTLCMVTCMMPSVAYADNETANFDSQAISDSVAVNPDSQDAPDTAVGDSASQEIAHSTTENSGSEDTGVKNAEFPVNADANERLADNELDDPSENVYSGSVVAAVSQNLSADSLVKESPSSEIEVNLTQENSVELSEADGESIIDTAVNPENGEMIYVTEPHFDMPTPQSEPADSNQPSNANDVLESVASIGTTKTIKDDNGVYRTLKCLYIGTYCTVWGCTSDEKANSGLVMSSSTAAQIGQQFDLYCPQITSAFGSWIDADNDKKLAIYCYDIDQNYINGVSGSYTAGYFMPANLINSAGYINGVYVGTSNYAIGTDCIHLDTYPAMSSSRYSLLDDVESTYSTLVHETQHLVNFSYQYAGGTKESSYDSMETYLNEAFSMAAEHMICGEDSTSNRIEYFNSSNYTAGSPLTYWASILSNYSNSYLFGQYIRTRYAQKIGNSDGNTLFQNVLKARQSAGGGDTLSMIAGILDTNSTQLVMDFWAAVYLKNPTGNYGFNGESWANTISPELCSPSTANSIYNGGAVFYNSSISTSQEGGIRFITFNEGDVEMSGAPAMSNVVVERTDASTIRFSFDSSKAGTLFYSVSTSTVTDRNSMTNHVGIDKGHTSFDINMNLDARQEGRLSYFVEDGNGNSGDISSAWIPAMEYPIYVQSSDRGTVTLTSNGNPINSGDYIAFGTEVQVTAEPKEGYYTNVIYIDEDELVGESFTVRGAHTLCALFSVSEVAAADSFHSGDGTETTPYVIDNVAEWKYFVTKVNSGDDMDGKFVVLSNDLDFEGQTISPVGISETAPFEGHFDGGKHTISNLQMSLDDCKYSGLFGYNGGHISNVKFKNVTMTSKFIGGTGYVGIVAGYNAGYIAYVDIQKESKCKAIGHSTAYVGGISGYNAGTISAAFSKSSVSLDDEAVYSLKWLYIGGIAGYCDAKGFILNCESEGTVDNFTDDISAASRVYSGGIVGYTSGEIENCIYTGWSTAYAEKAVFLGGIAGYQAGGSIKNIYVYKPDGSRNAYGRRNDSDAYCGGIVGYQTAGSISNGVAYQKSQTALIQSTTREGKVGYIAAVSNGTISKCYYNLGQSHSSFSTLTSNGEAVAASYLMKETFLASSVGFDMQDVWEIGAKPDVSRPTLKEYRKLDGYKIAIADGYRDSAFASEEYAYANEEISLYAKDDTKYVKSLIVNGVESAGNSFVATDDCTIVPIFGDKFKLTLIGNAVTCVTLDKQCAAPGETVTATITNTSGKANVYLLINDVPQFNTSFKVEKDSEIDVVFADITSSGSCGNSVYYKIFDNNTLYIYGTGNMNEYSESNYAPWYSKNTSIERVVIKEGVTSISAYAFYECTKLKNIVIPENITSIGEYAFYNCKVLESIDLPDSLKSIGAWAFADCSSLSKVAIPEGVTTIFACTFCRCDTLENVVLPNSLESIGNYAFYSCSSLESIVLPNGLKSVGGWAFYNCSLLESIVLPNSLESIGEYAFSYCSKLKEVYYIGNSTAWDRMTIGSNNSSLTDATRYYIADLSDIVTLTLLKVGSGTAQLSKTKTVKGKKIIVEATPGIGYKLSKIEVDGRVIEGNSFIATGNNTVKVTFESMLENANVTFGGNCGDDVHWALYDNGEMLIYGNGNMYAYNKYSSTAPWEKVKEKIKKVVVYEGVTSISAYAFYQCTVLEDILIPDSVNMIGKYAFYNCTALESIILQDGLKSVWESAFSGCSKLNDVYYIGNSIAWDCMEIKSDNNNLTNATRHYIAGLSDIATLTLLETENGTAMLSRTKTAKGEKVTVTATPEAGYKRSEIMVDGGVIEGNSFVVTGNNTVKVTFEVMRDNATAISGGRCGSDVYWALYEDGELLVSGTGNMDEYTSGSNPPWYGKRASIKKVIIEERVTSVSSYAFNACTTLESIALPDSLESVGEHAFYNCSKLNNVVIPVGITSIPNSGFAGCSSLESIALPDSLESIGEYAFYNCSRLNNIVIPNGVMSISKYAFSNCISLKNIVIPKGVSIIRENVFRSCTALESIIIPENIATIGGEAFYNCVALESIVLPASLKSIRSSAFSQCSKLKDVYYFGDSTAWSDITFDSDNNLLFGATRHYIADLSDIATLTLLKVGNGTATLSRTKTAKGEKITVGATPEAGYKLSKIEVDGIVIEGNSFIVTGNNTVKVIFEAMRADGTMVSSGKCGNSVYWTLYDDGEMLICGTGNMKEYSPYSSVPWYSEKETIKRVVIQTGVASVCAYAFYGCTSLEGIVLPDSLESIGERAFSNCSKLNDIVIPDAITSIPAYVFDGCTALESIVLPASLESIENSAFFNCSKLKDIVIPDGITSISACTFYGCSLLESVVLPDSLESIGEWAFFNCSKLKDIVIPKGISSIPEYAFYGCSSLESIVLPDSLESIGEKAFYNCSKLKDIVIPDGITSISACTFYGCSLLESVVLPDSLESIGERAFSNCSKLNDVYYVGDSTSWGSMTIESYNDHLVKATRHYITNVSDITTLTLLETENGTAALSMTKPAKGETVTVTAVPAAGYRLSKIEVDGIAIAGNSFVVTGNNTVKVTFEAMRANATVVSGGSCGENVCWALYEDGQLLIYGTGNMKEYSSYSSVPWYSEKETIKRVVIQTGVASVCAYAFYGCTALESVVLPDSLESIGEYAFYNCSKLNDVVIPDGITSISARTFYGCSSLESVVLPDSLESIGEHAFSNCSKLNDIVIPKGISSIPEYAFYGCTALESVVLPDSLESIGEYAFYNCSKLNDVVIPKGISSIPEYAFYGCSSLESIVLPNSLESIGSSAFSNCLKLKDVYYVGDSTSWGNMTIESYNDYLVKATRHYITNLSDIATLTLLETENGTAALSMTKPAKGETVTVTAVPAAGYRLSKIEVDGIVIAGNSFVVTGNNTVKVIFEVVRADGMVVSGGSCGENVYWALYEDGQLLIYGTGDMKQYSSYSSAPWYSSNKAITKVIIENGVTSIGKYAFYECSSLESIVLPDSLESIESSAFFNCSKLKDVYYVGDSTSWGNMTIKDYNDYLVNATRHYITNLSDIATLTLLETENGTAALSMTKPAKGETVTVTAVPAAGYRLSKIEVDGIVIEGNSFVVTGNNTVKVIFEVVRADGMVVSGGSCGENVYWALYEDGQLLIYGTGDMKQYGSYSSLPWYSSNKAITKVIIENGVTSIGEDAFYECSLLESIVLPDSLESIGEYAFYNCSKLKDIVIPDGITSISACTFYGCTALESIILPNSLESIGKLAFSQCSKLKDVYYVGDSASWGSMTIKSYNDYLVKATRHYITNLSDITTLTLLETENGTAALSMTKPAKGETVTVTAVPAAGYRLSKIEVDGIVIEGNSFVVAGNNTVKVIFEVVRADGMFVSGGSCGENVYWALYDDGELLVYGNGDMNTSYTSVPWKDSKELIKKIVIEEGVTSVSTKAFDECKAVETVELPDSIIEIGNFAFSKCSIETIKIPANVKKISNGAFSNCYQLKNVIFEGNLINAIEGYAFFGCRALANIEIPDSVAEIGEYAFMYSKIKTIAIPSKVTVIGASAFNQCTTLKEVTFKGNIDSIGESAFSGCMNLKHILLVDGVSRIGAEMFNVFTNLECIVMHNSMESVGENAFSTCSKLKDVVFVGTADDWDDISIETGNDYLLNARKTFTTSFNKNWKGYIDGNYRVDFADALTLKRYIANWKGYEKIDTDAADLNSDGLVDPKDLIILERHIAGWQGYETLPMAGATKEAE